MTDSPADIANRLDGPIDGHFGLSYANYLVLHRTLMQSMPVDWQARAVEVFEELDRAFSHIDRPAAFNVECGRDAYFDELTPDELDAAGITRLFGADRFTYEDRDGRDREGHEHVFVPTGADPVPHYNRGRTYVAPAARAARRSGAPPGWDPEKWAAMSRQQRRAATRGANR